MPTAFGLAMLATINGQPQRFRMTMLNGPAVAMNCRDFLTTRHEENQLLEDLNLPNEGTVLDWGCGVGRHLSQVRLMRAAFHCCGIDISDLMLDYCRAAIGAPATFARTFEEFASQQFDLVMLMGNGLGVLGGEENATYGLGLIVDALRPSGRIVLETGNPFGRGYCAPEFTIDYGEHHDGPFPWGYSDRDWISRTLERLGCTVALRPSHAPGGVFFFAVAQRRE